MTSVLELFHRDTLNSEHIVVNKLLYVNKLHLVFVTLVCVRTVLTTIVHISRKSVFPSGMGCGGYAAIE